MHSYPVVCTRLLWYVLVSWPPGARMSSPVVCTRLLTSKHSYVLVSCRMYSSPDLWALVCTRLLSHVLVSWPLGTRMYLSPVVCTCLLTSRHSYVLVSCTIPTRMYSIPIVCPGRMYSSPFVSELVCSFRPNHWKVLWWYCSNMISCYPRMIDSRSLFLKKLLTK